MNFNKLVLACVVIILTGCGGGSSSSDEPTKQIGVILDSPVINIGYRTDTLEGVTNSLGEYEYIEGETVTFFIGDLEFPEVTATGTITPLELVGTQDTNNSEVINIIRLLQTLDKDSNPDNGITITDAAISTATQVDFGLLEAEFAASSAVDVLITGAGQDTPVTDLVNTDDALAHFEQELSDNDIEFGSLIGSWRLTEGFDENQFLFLSFFDDGTYMHAQIDPVDDANDDSVSSGMEWGTYSFNESTGLLTEAQTFDNNGDYGLGDNEEIRLNVSGNTLTGSFKDNDGPDYFDVVFQRVTSDDLLGTWRNTETSNDFLILAFFDDGTYIHAEVDSEDLTEASGMEWGTYSRNETTGELTVTQTFDNNGDTGLTDDIARYALVSDDTLTLQIDENNNGTIEEDESIEFERQ